jgi:alpha-1,2-mannosyltransferase
MVVALLALYLTWRVLLALGVPLAKYPDSAVDFEGSFWPAGRHVLHGQSPFPPPTRNALATGFAFVYPAPTALLVAPFALLPVHPAAALFTVLLFACALLALYAVGVRDLRCYLAIFFWWPMQAAIQTANVTLLLTLGAALVWRYRDRRILVGVTAGAFIALKLLLWPIFIWLLATRRYAAAAWALVAGLVLTFGSWAVLGFAGLRDYVPALRLLTKLEERASYTPLSAALKFGLGLSPARALGALVAVAVLAYLVFLARRNDERRAYVVALAACILCSPIVWLHYYALLVVALGLLSPQFSVLWVLPIVTFGPVRPAGPTWWTPIILAVFAAMLAVAMANRSVPGERSQP